MITHGIKYFARLFPELNRDKCLNDEYNRRMRMEGMGVSSKISV